MVAEEERAVVLRGIPRAGVERDGADHGAIRSRAAVTGNNRSPMRVRVVRRHGRAGRVEGVAEVQVRRLIPGLPPVPLVAGPAEIRRPHRRVEEAVDLLPIVPADVADPYLVRSRPEDEAERVSHPVGNDPARVRARARCEGVARSSGACSRIDAQERAAQEHGFAGGPADALRAQRTSLGRRRSLRPADTGRRVTARVQRRRRACMAACLPIVDEIEAGPVAAGHVEVAVRPEAEVTDRVARELLAPLAADQGRAAGDRVPGEL
jgi:hypothetical protein